MLVGGGEQEFGYTIGIHRTFGKPEFLVAGLSRETMHELCNQYGNDIKAGISYALSDQATNWFDNAAVRMVFIEVHDDWKPFFLGKLVDLMEDRTIPVLQGVWSDEQGRMPLEPGFNPDLEGRQFFLNQEPEYD